MQTRSSVQVYQDSGGGGFRMRSALTYKLLIGFLSLTTLTTIGLGISTGVLSYQNGAIKERFKDQSLSLKECQVSCQKCECSGGGDQPEPEPTPSVSCSNMYKISGTLKVDEQEINLTKYFTFRIENITNENGEDYTIEQVCQNTEECKYEAQQAITVDNYGRLNIKNLQEVKDDDEMEFIDVVYNIYNTTWGMPQLYEINQSSVFIDTFNLGINETITVNNQTHIQAIIVHTNFHDHGVRIEALEVDNITINGNVYRNIQVDGSVGGNIIFGKDTEDVNDMSDSVITGNIIVNGGIRGHVTIQKDITTIGESALKVGNIKCGGQEVPIGSNCVQMGNINAYLGTNETPLAAIKLKSVTANNNGDGIQVEESITAPYSAIDVASDLSSSQYPVITVTGDIKATGNNDAISVSKNIILSGNGKGVYVIGYIQGNNQNDVINIMCNGCEETQYGVTGGITIDNGVNGYVSLGNVACGSEGNGVEKCVSIGDVEAYLKTTTDKDGNNVYYSAVKTGSITANDNGYGLNVTGDVSAGYTAVQINGDISSNNTDANTAVLLNGSISSVITSNGVISDGGIGVLISGNITSYKDAIQVGQQSTSQDDLILYQLNSTTGYGFKLLGDIHGGTGGGILVGTVGSKLVDNVPVYTGGNINVKNGYGVDVFGSITSDKNDDGTFTRSSGIYVHNITVGGDGVYIGNGGIQAGSYGTLNNALNIVGNIICGNKDKLIKYDCIYIKGNVEAYVQNDVNYENGDKRYAAINIDGSGDNAGIKVTNGQGIKVTGNIDSTGHALYVNGYVKSTEGMGVNIKEGIVSKDDCINVNHPTTSNSNITLQSSSNRGVYINGHIKTYSNGINVKGNINSLSDDSGILIDGDISSNNGNAIQIGEEEDDPTKQKEYQLTADYGSGFKLFGSISGGKSSVNVTGNVQNAPITITGNLYALDVSGQVGYSSSETAIKAGSVLGGIDLGTEHIQQTPNNLEQGTQGISDIPLKAAPSTSAIQGSINVYGDMSCSNNVCVNIGGEIDGNVSIQGINGGSIKVNQNNNSSNTVSIGEIYVSGSATNVQIQGECTTLISTSIGTLNTSDITTALNIIYDAPAEGGNNPTNVIEKIALYDSSNTNTPTLTVSGITNTPSITGLTNGNVQINTIKDDSISEIIISNINNNPDDETYNVIGSIKLGKSNDASPSVQISGIDNTFDINTITTPGTIESLDANITECPTNSDTITLSPPPKYLTLAFNGTSTMESIKIQDASQNNKIIISGISSSFDITNLITKQTISNLTVEGADSSLANVSLVDYATIGTVNIEVPATTPSSPSAVISKISLYPTDSTYDNSQLNIEGVYNNNSISKINAQGSIGTADVVKFDTITSKTINTINLNQTLLQEDGSVNKEITILGGINYPSGTSIIGSINGDKNISSITGNSIGTITASTIGSTDASTSTALNVVQGITGGVSLGNVNCGDNDNRMESPCVTIGIIESYSNSAKPVGALRTSGITSNGGPGVQIIGSISSYHNAIQVGRVQQDSTDQTLYKLDSTAGYGFILYGDTDSKQGIRIATRDNDNTLGGNVYGTSNGFSVDKSVISVSGSAINVGQRLKENEIAINCGESTGLNGDCVSIANISASFGGSGGNSIKIGHIQALGGAGAYITSINSRDNSIQVEQYIDSNQGTAISVGSYIKTLSKAISITGKTTCGEKIDGGSSSPTSNNCVEFNDVEIYWDQPEAERKAAITVGNIKANNSNAIIINNITADYNGVEISNGIVSNNSQAINVGPITCGTNESLTTSNCVQMGDITIFGEKGKTYYPNATYINSITSYNNSNGIGTNGNVKSDKHYAIRINGDVSSGASALYVDGNIYATSGYGVFVYSGVTCGTTTELNNYNCVSLTNVRLFGTTTAIAIKATTIYANNGSNGIYVTSTVGGYTTKQSIYIGGQIECGNGSSSCVKLSSIKSKSPGINVDTITCGTSTNLITNNCVSIGNVEAYLTTTVDEDNPSNITYYSAVKTGSITANNNGYGLNVTGAVSAGYTAVQINGGITSTNIAANVPAVLIDGGVSGAITVNNGGVDQISVDNSIGSLTAGGITNTATINGNVGQLNILNVVEPVKESDIINVVNSINLYRPNDKNSILSIGSITNKPSISSVTNGNVQINTITDESIEEIIISNIDTDPSSTYNVIGSIELENPDNSSSVQISGIDNTFDINTITTPGQIETLKSENINKDDCLTNSDNMTLSPPPKQLTLVFNDDSSMDSIKIQDGNQNDKIIISGISKSFDITSLTGNSIGTITASSIGSTDTSTSTVLSITNGITGGVSLGNVNCGNVTNLMGSNCVEMGDITTYGGSDTSAIKTDTITSYNTGNGVYVSGSIDINSGRGIKVDNGIIVNSSGYGMEIENGKNIYAIQAQGTSGGIYIAGNIISEGTSIEIYGNVKSTLNDGIYTYNIEGYTNGIQVLGTVTATYQNGYAIKVTKNITSGGIKVNNKECTCPA